MQKTVVGITNFLSHLFAILPSNLITAGQNVFNAKESNTSKHFVDDVENNNRDGENVEKTDKNFKKYNFFLNHVDKLGRHYAASGNYCVIIEPIVP